MDDKPQTAQRFRTVLQPVEGMDTAVLAAPFDVFAAFGKRGIVPVRITINGHTFRTSIAPRTGGHYTVVNKSDRAAAGVSAGDEVDVLMERDDEPRTVAMPPALQAALEGSPEALAAWEKLSVTARKEHAEAIEGAKTEPTRRRRVEKAAAVLIERAAKERK